MANYDTNGFWSTLFVQWIWYADPWARVRKDGDIAMLFPLKRGTRQVCPLSPLLSHYQGQMLNSKREQMSEIVGICCGPVKKISLYVDDALIYLDGRERSFLPSWCRWWRCLERFHSYRWVGKKSQAIPIGPSIPVEYIQWSRLQLTSYLGIQIHSDLSRNEKNAVGQALYLDVIVP